MPRVLADGETVAYPSGNGVSRVTRVRPQSSNLTMDYRISGDDGTVIVESFTVDDARDGVHTDGNETVFEAGSRMARTATKRILAVLGIVLVICATVALISAAASSELSVAVSHEWAVFAAAAVVVIVVAPAAGWAVGRWAVRVRLPQQMSPVRFSLSDDHSKMAEGSSLIINLDHSSAATTERLLSLMGKRVRRANAAIGAAAASGSAGLSALIIGLSFSESEFAATIPSAAFFVGIMGSMCYPVAWFFWADSVRVSSTVREVLDSSVTFVTAEEAGAVNFESEISKESSR